MTITINGFDMDKDFFYTDRFKTLVRSERELLRKEATEIPLLEPTVKYAFRNDFYRLIRHYGIPNYMHWVTAYINDISDPFKDISGMSHFLAIDESLLYSIVARTNTARA